MSIVSTIEISHYRNRIPPSVETTLERLYGSLYSTLAYFRIYGGAENADTYIARRDGVVTAVFLFRLEGKLVRVLNEGMHAPHEELERFVNFAFAIHRDAGAVVFNAVRSTLRRCWRPHQSAICTDDMAVTLDRNVPEYLARLGAATRKNIRRHRNKLERDHPSFRFDAHGGASIDERIVRDVIALNQRRMEIKGKQSALDESETARIVRLVRERGLVTVATVDGQVAAGAIVLHIGDCFCSLVNAHDPRYDAHRLGTICCFLTICESIERGGKRFDLMWGHYDYKTALLGEHSYLYRMIVYRSRWRQAAHLPLAAATASAGFATALRMRLLETANQEGKGHATPVAKALHALRGWKRSLSGLAACL